MLNLSLRELRLIAKNRNINGYESMSKDKLLRINNNKKGDRKNDLKLKKEETRKSISKPTRNSLFKLKREEIKKSLYKSARKNLFKSKIVEIKENFYDPIINRDEMIEEIKLFMIQK